MIAMELTRAFLEGKNVGYQTEGEDTIKIGFRGLRNMGVIGLKIHFHEENDIICITYHCPFPIPKEKIKRFYALCSDLNRKHRFAKFYIAEDQTIGVCADAVVSSGDAGKHVYTIAHMLPAMIDEAFPVLMKEMWSNRADSAEHTEEE